MSNKEKISDELKENIEKEVNEYRIAKQLQIEKLKRLIPYLHMYSPEDRKMIEEDMKKYGIKANV